MNASGTGLVQRLRDFLPHLGLDADHLLVPRGELPHRLQESNLQAWSYAPDFTPLVQHLLQLRRAGRSLSIGVCGPEAASTARAYAAVQMGVGFSQHGLRAVIVDADITRPGLAGLVSDPHQEGLVDMVRFGRSCRALLQRPVEGGPAILGIGSFPLEGPAPFEPDAWLGIVHRVSVHADVALYVAPLHVGGDTNPLAQATDQVVYVPAADGGAATEREMERLRRSEARVAAVILCAPPAPSDVPSLRPPVQPAEAEIPEVEPLLSVELPREVASAAFEIPRADVPATPPSLPPLPLPPPPLPPEPPPPLPPASELPPEVTALPSISPPPFELEPQPAPEAARRDFPPPPPWGEEEVASPPASAPLPSPLSALELEPVAVGAASDTDSTSSHEAAARPTEEASRLRQRLQLDDADFSYSEGGKQSRLPLYMFVAVVVTIGGFLGWALWSQREINRRAQEILAGAAEPGPGDKQPASAPPQRPAQQPPQVAVKTPSGSTPDDEAASAGNGASKPPTPPSQAQTPPVQQAVQQESPPAPATTTEPSPPPQQPVAPAPESGGTAHAEPAMVYAVHVASYRKLEQANQDLANLRKNGFEGRAVRTDLGSKGIWYRVYVGSYPTKEAATAAREKIVKLPGYDAFAQVRRIAVP